MKPQVLIVAHDAGGAEILAAWCTTHRNDHELFIAVQGPAARIFQRDRLNLPHVELEFMERFRRNDFVLTATSLEADLERRAIALAKRHRIHSVSFLDHWDLYRERFGNVDSWRNGLPDEIWVGDEYAFSFALQQGFAENRLRQVVNPYFEAIKNLGARGEKNHQGRGRILYVCEPISRKLAAAFAEKAPLYHDELAIMENFLQTSVLHREKIESVTLRLHPSEQKAKYEEIVRQFQPAVPVVFSGEALLADDVLNHSVVIGIESNALVIASLLGKPAFSCITGKQWQISLPHKEIRRLDTFQQFFQQSCMEKT